MNRLRMRESVDTRLSISLVPRPHLFRLLQRGSGCFGRFSWHFARQVLRNTRAIKRNEY